MKDKLKFGVIGCGEIANLKHLPALSKQWDAEVVALCDIIKERAEKAAKEYGTVNAKVYIDYKEMLKDESIDVVHVCTPNRSHCEITVASLKAGKHVLCEKPMAATEEDARKMLKAASGSGKKLTIGYQNRYRPECLYLHKVCERGDLGEIYYARAHAVRRRGVPTWGVFLNESEQGGGPLIDIGTHALDLTLWMMNNYKPVSVKGSVFKKLRDKWEGNIFGPWNPDEYTVEDSAFGFITMENGATIYLEASWALNIMASGEGMTTLCGTEAGADMFEGNLRINKADMNQLVTIQPEFKTSGVAYFPGAKIEPNIYEVRQWIDCIKNDTDPIVLPEQAFTVTQILEAIYKSGKTGETVFFK